MSIVTWCAKKIQTDRLLSEACCPKTERRRQWKGWVSSTDAKQRDIPPVSAVSKSDNWLP